MFCKYHPEVLHLCAKCPPNLKIYIQPQVESPVEFSSIWHKDVPLKVVVFAWRLFRDRLPTKDNLLRRGVITHDSRMCVAGCDFVESSSHLFLHCNIFGSVWHLIYSWIWILVTNPFSLALVVESERSGAQFYRLYGMQLSRKSGRKETIGYLQAKKAPFFRWWIGLSPSPICGWRRSTLLFPSICMAGGLVHSPYWA